MDETKLQETLKQAIRQYIMDQPQEIRQQRTQSFLECLRGAVMENASELTTASDHQRVKYPAELGKLNPVMQEPYLDQLYVLSTPYAYTATINYFQARNEEVEAGLTVRALIEANLTGPQETTATLALVRVVRRYLFPRNWLGRLAVKVLKGVV